ncbi:hypothetical protein N7462_007079 [Penicillium macrosclerotiorum]|uniref:uncharacterized protein n=1 Tax=Penicillium macrosclerotiorum TaxID=303699 RepID=UPI0025493FB1|nr:uncharacterized protein N7462_007079 [Penicillium macrosclerotiorum]KAJ5678835.1 hypothetical protein N7462_007079 [Penicillium macrosclerotiorum]
MIMAQGIDPATSSAAGEAVMTRLLMKELSLPGSETSIIRIAGAGFRLSLLLNAAACQLAQSRLEIHSIAKGISLFALTLKHLGQTLEKTEIEYSSEAMEKAWEIASQGQMIFVDIEHMLDKLQGTDTDDELRRIPLQERLKWCFRKQHVTFLLAQLESLKLSLIVVVRILQLGNLIQSGTDNTSVGPLELSSDDTVAQEKAETQNMIIVRYWSVKRLDRLWDCVEQEALEAANDQTNQRIHSTYFTNTAAAVKPLIAATKGSDLTKPHPVTFGDCDVGLSDLERSPKDMVHLSESAMNHLLLMWVPSLDASKIYVKSGARGISQSAPPQVCVSSDCEDDAEDLDWEGHNSRGYYLEGSTEDWRKPHSQEARRQAAELRRQYSGYQARVESDDETNGSSRRREPRPKDPRITDSGDEDEQRTSSRPPPKTVTINDGGRAHSSSISSRYPSSQTSDGRPTAYPSGSFQPAATSIPRSQPPSSPSQPLPPHLPGPPKHHYRHHSGDIYTNTAPRSIPGSQSNVPPAMSIPSPRSTPPSPFETGWARPPNYNNHLLQPRPRASAYPLSTSFPESNFRPSPPRSAQRSPTHSHRRSSREEAKERHKALKRDATRGIAGIGAIAGFMDALEAFSVL